jgi:type I restriction-modification system DNA methylase subunit
VAHGDYTDNDIVELYIDTTDDTDYSEDFDLLELNREIRSVARQITEMSKRLDGIERKIENIERRTQWNSTRELID